VGVSTCCPDLSCVEGLLFQLWRVCCFSLGGLVVFFVVFLLSQVVDNIFWGSILWQNCPTVHIDRDQTLEV
jgi:hypothetical protein